MPPRRMRVELFDSEGNKYTVAFEGQITREKALRLLDLMELLGGTPKMESSPSNSPTMPNKDFSKYDKVRVAIEKHFPLVWFSSKEVQSVYEQEFKQPIGISTVATYLARMANKGLLTKIGASNRLRYKSPQSFPQATIKSQVP